MRKRFLEERRIETMGHNYNYSYNDNKNNQTEKFDSLINIEHIEASPQRQSEIKKIHRTVVMSPLVTSNTKHKNTNYLQLPITKLMQNQIHLPNPNSNTGT